MNHCTVCPYPNKCTARVKCVLGKVNIEEVEIKMPDPKPEKTAKVVKMPKKTQEEIAF